MSKFSRHPEIHRSYRIGWLRAAVLGANDGIVSTASLIVGVAAAGASRENILLSGIAGLVAGAMSMAAGEYVSVSSQSDTEKADLATEKRELETNPEFELEELTQIYVYRGLDYDLAKEVAHRLTEHDALGSHARDELGILESSAARPMEAAMASAFTFSIGGLLPLIVVFFVPLEAILPFVFSASILSLVLLGVFSAKAGGASILKAALRVGFWGAFAMALTAAVGSIFNVVV